MYTIKKLLFALSAVMLIILSTDDTVFASEIPDQLSSIEGTSESTDESADDSSSVDITYSLEIEDVTNNVTEELIVTETTESNIEANSTEVDAIEEYNVDVNLAEDSNAEINSIEDNNAEINSIEDNNAEISSIEDNETEDIELDVISIDDIDLDKYEIIEDEQGQVYYVEKEPKAIVIEEVIEEVNEDTEEKAEAKDKKPSYSKNDLRLLACLVYSEAGNQSYKGMLAVANVVLNRVKSDAYYHVDTIKEVIYDREWSVQFSVTIKSKKTGKSMLDRALELYDTGNTNAGNPDAERKAMQKATKAAKAALEGENNIGDYLCFRMNNGGASSIKKKYKYIIIGDHIFYRTK